MSVTDATLGKDLMTVTLTTTPQPSGTALTLTAAGLRDIQGGIPTAPASVAVDLLPAEIAADAGTFAAGYRVVYTLDIPVCSDFGRGIPDPYLFNAAASGVPFSRVAYYLALGQRPFASPARQYAWTSMDAFTPFLSKIGIPNTATKAIFAQIVTNLTVRSNKSGVINGEFDTGNIEFWPSNYGTGNDRGIPGASGSTYDFGDGGFSGSAGHGSFQVHNYLNAQTVFGINRWGDNRTSSVSLGIGTPASTETLNSSDKDWTFAENAAAYASRRLYVLARPEVPVPAETLDPPAEVIAHVLEQVPDVTDYRHLYTVDIPRQPKFADAAVRPTYYSVDNATRFANTPHTRVAYFLELVKNNVTSFCWTAFDPICVGVNRLGVPANDDFFQQTVSNLDVFSNVNGVVNTNGCDTGNIEFWDWDYQQTNAAAIPGASDSTFDFGDRRGASRGGGYGSMQVHNYGAGQTCWALSRFGNCGGNDSVCVGIGNNPSGSPDWTHSNSGANWDSRRLLVFIKPEPQAPAIPAEVLANVPDAAAFKHLYTIDIPVRARFDVDASNTLYYSVDNAATLNGAFGRGSFQVHNYRLGQTLFAVNSWGNDNRAIELGIGNRPTGAPDWTGSGAYNEYSSRTLYVFVRPSAVAPMEPVPDPGWGTLPTIILSPTDQRVDVKASAFFAVLARDATRYQWCKDGVIIPGATASTLEIPNVRGRHTGSYTVLVYGSGSRYVVSLPALLEVNADGTRLILQ
ncbi:MAG: hypothetical protein KBI41_06285 [Kiritimatiellae bacterium]|nr:hypothetical protein [Kiritimatiellia bacterium]MDD2347233.1 immunoglobulin domain-containing protein [Kiritimatiellia bacterium]MDD3584487.1 immunoglobulin domain-containing protein [Kiritimatiellia bacterium]